MRSRKLSYGKMQEELWDQIHSGELAPGAALPSENQLALKYSICRSSVRTGLLALEQKNLIGRQAGKGWFVRVSDTSLLASEITVASRFYTIAADLNFLSVPWYHQIIFNGIREACRSYCIRQVFYNASDLNSLRKGFCDGLICALSGSYGGMKENPLLMRLPELGIHPVVVNRFYEHPDIGYVSCDYQLEAQRGAEFLKKMGAARICYIKAVDHVVSLRARECGVKLCYTPDEILVYDMPSNLSIPEYTAEVLRLFQKKGTPEVFYLENGSFGLPLMKAFLQMGIRPDSAPVIFCFDDISYLHDFYDYSAYFLRMPLEQMMKDSIQYLVKKTDEPSTPVLKKIYRAEIKKF